MPKRWDKATKRAKLLKKTWSFNRKIKISHWNVTEHPKPEMGFLEFELKQRRGLSGAASLLFFCFIFDLASGSLLKAWPAKACRNCSVACKLHQSQPFVCCPTEPKFSIRTEAPLWGARQQSHGKSKNANPPPASQGKHGPFSNSCVWPPLCLL